MLNKNIDLCTYRIDNAIETLGTTKLCLDNKRYKDTINRSYYAVFYAIKAILALEGTDFKRHKDVVAYFNKNYVATGIFEKAIGKRLAHLQQKRESSDYDDFYIASKEEAEEQYEAAKDIIQTIRNYLAQNIQEDSKK